MSEVKTDSIGDYVSSTLLFGFDARTSNNLVRGAANDNPYDQSDNKKKEKNRSTNPMPGINRQDPLIREAAQLADVKIAEWPSHFKNRNIQRGLLGYFSVRPLTVIGVFFGLQAALWVNLHEVAHHSKLFVIRFNNSLAKHEIQHKSGHGGHH